MALTRIEPIQQSMQDWAREYLDDLGYASSYEMRDSYPYDLSNPLEKTLVVLTKTVSFPITYHEVGGPLVSEEHNFAFDVLGASEKLGANIARHIEERFKTGSFLPGKDFQCLLRSRTRLRWRTCSAAG